VYYFKVLSCTKEALTYVVSSFFWF